MATQRSMGSLPCAAMISAPSPRLFVAVTSAPVLRTHWASGTKPLVMADPDRTVIPDDDRTDHRIGLDKTASPHRQLQRPGELKLIVMVQGSRHGSIIVNEMMLRTFFSFRRQCEGGRGCG